jgi:coproporphyrinogen III oxidase-like Fe-S oxidoreductase
VQHGQRALPQQRYIDALIADLEASLPLVWGRPVHSIFIGGGTPSLFSPQAIDRLLGDIRARLPLSPIARSRSRPTPAPSRRTASRPFALPA